MARVRKSLLLILVFAAAISIIVLGAANTAYANLQDEPFPGGNNSFNNSSISLKAQNNISHAPVSLSIGNGYYSGKPVIFGTNIGSETWIKNSRLPTSMHHEIDYAHEISGSRELLAQESSYQMDGQYSGGMALTHMSIDEEVVDGTIHIGVLQGTVDPAAETGARSEPMTSALKDPTLEIIEDYVGTYHIKKNMTIEMPYQRIMRNDSWLDCCPGGYFDMNYYDRVFISADQVFNCNCVDCQN